LYATAVYFNVILPALQDLPTASSDFFSNIFYTRYISRTHQCP
jgi:hypothetical protein